MGFSGAGRARNDIFLGFRGRAGTVSRFGGRGRAEPAMVSRASARNNFGGFAVSRFRGCGGGRSPPQYFLREDVRLFGNLKKLFGLEELV